MAMLELFLPLAINTHPSQAPSLSRHYRLLLLVGQFDELTSHREAMNVRKGRRSPSVGNPVWSRKSETRMSNRVSFGSSEALPSLAGTSHTGSVAGAVTHKLRFSYADDICSG
ncbi:hypothetical protein PS647_02459 [Pseudomonas fluorescens]|jgi:hypothetical protein|nr:hypothetical protein PS647_02459 [Pseudomonas fluorescens]